MIAKTINKTLDNTLCIDSIKNGEQQGLKF
jgi:hypothetical protein